MNSMVASVSRIVRIDVCMMSLNLPLVPAISLMIAEKYRSALEAAAAQLVISRALMSSKSGVVALRLGRMRTVEQASRMLSPFFPEASRCHQDPLG